MMRVKGKPMASPVYHVEVKPGDSPKEWGMKAVKLFEKAGFGKMIEEGRFVALKQHFGEGKDGKYLRAPVVRSIVDLVKAKGAKPYLTETATLYRGQRSNAVDHLNLAYDHGFTPDAVGCPVICCDGLVGAAQVMVKIDGKHYREVPIASDIFHTHALIVLTHMTGHLAAGIGGSIKNSGMGLSSRAGKMNQHHDSHPIVEEGKCTACGTCVEWCPTDAISMKGKASVDGAKCIGCGECLAVCPAGAVGFEWGESAGRMQEKMAEHALGVSKLVKGRAAYFNFAVNMTPGCDCFAIKQNQLAADAGIFASADPVALDQATADAINKQAGKDVFKATYPEFKWDVQLKHGEVIGLGTRKYQLIQVE